MAEASREEVIHEIARRVDRLELSHPARVGVDGPSAAGKTIFSDELAAVLRGMGREVIRAGLDGFHNPPEIRHRQGPHSVDGYLDDSFDFKAVRRHVLDPLGPRGDLSYVEEIFDHKLGEACDPHPERADAQAILVFEGVTLFREELADAFDYKILVQASFAVVLERAKTRDLDHFGNMETLLNKYTQRFIPGQRRYLEERRPEELVDALVTNDDWNRPMLELA